MLDFQRPSFDGGIQAFDEMCRNSLSAEDAARLAKVSISNPAVEIVSEIQKKFIVWDTNLRNAVANIAMPDGGASKYLRKEEDYFSEIESIDNCFPEIDYRVYQSITEGVIPQQEKKLAPLYK